MKRLVTKYSVPNPPHKILGCDSLKSRQSDKIMYRDIYTPGEFVLFGRYGQVWCHSNNVYKVLVYAGSMPSVVAKLLSYKQTSFNAGEEGLFTIDGEDLGSKLIEVLEIPLDTDLQLKYTR